MAERWLRGPVSNSSIAGGSDYIDSTKEHSVWMYYFLRYLLNFSHVDQVVAGGLTYNNHHQQNGTDGILTNSDYNFSSASATFTSGHVGEFLVLLDSVNDLNCGIYEITAFTDANNVTIDFLTPAGNYPTAATSISWFLLDEANSPNTDGDFWVLESPNATYPLTIKGRPLSLTASGGHHGTGLEISVGSATDTWDSGANDWLSNAPTLTEYCAPRGYVNWAQGPIYAYGKNDGTVFLSWCDANGGGSSYIHLAGFSVLSTFESGRPNRDLICAFGHKVGGGAGATTTGTRGINADDWGIGSVWSTQKWKEVDAYWAGYYDNSQDYFRRNLGLNSRTSKRDGLPIWIFGDPNNSQRLFAPWGALDSSITIATTISLGVLQEFDSDTYFHIKDSTVVPWPGIPT